MNPETPAPDPGGEPSLFPVDAPVYSDHPRVMIGTSGYSFPDWVGPFYPKGTASNQFLPFYARNFPIVEVNVTYYRIPAPKTLEQMQRRTPPGFRFMVKLHGSFTHERQLETQPVQDFHAALAPLKTAGKYEGLLAQFPWGFRRNDKAERHLSRLRDAFPGDPLFVEFRHDSWADADVPDLLREKQLGYCMVDEPKLEGLMPPVVWRTTDDAYVRFHGRNADNWWAGRATGQDRYDYNYSEEELREWLRKIGEMAEQARRTYLFFNNCHAGQAARNAKLMQELVRQQTSLS
jgi:uncharacterized protein YecE (DUF72 family)